MVVAVAAAVVVVVVVVAVVVVILLLLFSLFMLLLVVVKMIILIILPWCYSCYCYWHVLKTNSKIPSPITSFILKWNLDKHHVNGVK